MYKVLKIHKYAATRDVELENVDTGTIDLCFDHSATVSLENFNFMVEGEVYDCKILLLDGFKVEKTTKSVEVNIADLNAIVGERRCWKITIGQDVYYVPLSQTKDVDINGKLYYDIMRKDLVQVDGVIHADCLRNTR